MKFKMLHTCIRVKDLDESLKFYTQAIGFKEVERKDFPEDEFTLVYLTDEAGNYELELTYNYDREEAYDLGNGFAHTAVTTDDLEKARDFHRELGYEVTDLMGLSGEDPRYYFVTDPDGYLVEVLREE